jgi:hypothetical protein
MIAEIEPFGLTRNNIRIYLNYVIQMENDLQAKY